MKKLIFILFGIIVVCSANASYSFSAVTSSGHTLYYLITSNSTVSVVHPNNQSPYYPTGAQTSGRLVIPDSVWYNGVCYFVTSISDKAFKIIPGGTNGYTSSPAYGWNIEYVYIPKSVTLIGSDAFVGCHNLRTIEWNVISYNYMDFFLDEYAYTSNSLDTLIIGEDVDTIPFFRFQNHSDNDYPNHLILNARNAKHYCLDPSGDRYSGVCYHPFEKIEIGTGVRSIPDNFTQQITNKANWNNGTDTIILSSDLQYIGDNAFAGCMQLPINLHHLDSLVYIGESAFYNCRQLEGFITIPNGSTQIPPYVFYNCIKIAGQISIPNTVRTIGYYSFYGCSSIIGNIHTNSVDTIGEYAFFNCERILGVNIGDSAIEIGNSAFEGCSRLREVMFGNNLNSAD